MSQKLKKIFFYGSFLFLLILMVSMYFVISSNKIKVELYFKHNDKINTLISHNNYFNNFLSDKKDYILFDPINKKIKEYYTILNKLETQAKEFHMDQNYIKNLQKLKIQIKNKEIWLERYKARKSVESKIMFYILDRKNSRKANLSAEMENRLNKLRVDLLESIQTNSVDDIDLIKNYKIDSKNSYINNFLNQTKALKNSIEFQSKYINKAINTNIDQKLKETKVMLSKERAKAKEIFFGMMNILAFLIIFFTIVLIYFFIKLSKTKDQLGAFKKAVENSDNVVVMTDKNSKITFANEAFEKVSGYTIKEALGQNPSVLKSGYQDKSFYKDLNKTIKSGNTWKGRFINKKRDGEVFYENATITPIFSEGKIDGYLAIKLDVTESVLHAKQLDELNRSLEKRVQEAVGKIREKDNLILNQTKMAALGEMIGNIAHQWRQPLSVISTTATSIALQSEMGILEKEQLNGYVENINKNAQYLSKTIDDFRNFIKGDSKKEEFNLKETMESFISLVDTSIKKHNINIKMDIDKEIKIIGLKNELNQCLINLFNNSKDAMDENNIKNKQIKIKIEKTQDSICIFFEDNAGGIPEDIIDKIFEPYFTTKHQSIGTGLGLNMVYRIITEGMNGTINVSNSKMKIEDKIYNGAKFTIIIPKKL